MCEKTCGFLLWLLRSAEGFVAPAPIHEFGVRQGLRLPGWPLASGPHEPRTAGRGRARLPPSTLATVVALGASLKGSFSNLSLIFQQNEKTLEGSFSSVSTPNFARKYSLESS